MSDTQNDGEIIAYLPGGIELRTAHGADGKFTSGGGGAAPKKHSWDHLWPHLQKHGATIPGMHEGSSYHYKVNDDNTATVTHYPSGTVSRHKSLALAHKQRGHNKADFVKALQKAGHIE